LGNDSWRDDFVEQTDVQRAIKCAAEAARQTRRVTSLTYRHSFAMHLPESGYDIQTTQEPLGHSEVSITMIYPHVLNRGGRGVSMAPVPSPRRRLFLQIAGQRSKVCRGQLAKQKARGGFVLSPPRRRLSL
jgi:Phage integrase family